MRKAFRVATVLTGAAACVTALPSAAMAAPATAPRTPLIQPDNIGNCTAGTSTTSVHLYWNASEHHGPTCVGGHTVKTWGSTGPQFSRLCPGNNNGLFQSVHLSLDEKIYYGVKNGRGGVINTVNYNAWSISNRSWNGTQTCGY
jgi:hypothetical protein